MTDHVKLVLGVDGGGSKTCAWLGSVNSDTSQRSVLSVLGKAIGGPSNVRALGFDAALENVRQAIADAFAAAGISQVSVARACISLAGAGRTEEQARVVQWAEQQSLADKVRVVGDAEVVLAAAFPSDESGETPVGISLIAGTGSMAWGQNARREQARCGGWGYLLGDEGSAFDLGRQALQLVCQTADGRASAQALLRGVLEHLRLESSEQLIAWCYGGPNARERIASLAPLIFSISDQDRWAAEIIDRGAGALAVLVCRVGHSLHLPAESYRLALTGSVLVKQPQYVAAVLSVLEQLGFLPAQHCSVHDPVAGALHLAAYV